MNRIEKKLGELKEQGKKALITYVTCGDGGYDATEKAVYETENEIGNEPFCCHIC